LKETSSKVSTRGARLISTIKIPGKEIQNGNGKPSQNGKNGSSLTNGDGNGHAYGGTYSERVLSNSYLASYVLYAFARSLNGRADATQKSSARILLSFKRVLDILLSAIGLTILSPVLMIMAVLIKLDSEGPVFYKQERIGLNRRRSERRGFDLDCCEERRRCRDRRREEYYGKPFIVCKLRTMVKDAEKKCGPTWATKDDPRINRFGRFLRKTRLDELPQLWNVLRGDMSLVGPRPERLYFVRKFAPQVKNYAKRLSVKPGITGLAQVERGYDSSHEDVSKKIRYDLHYINNWSLWRDIKILAKTGLVVITGKGV